MFVICSINTYKDQAEHWNPVTTPEKVEGVKTPLSGRLFVPLQRSTLNSRWKSGYDGGEETPDAFADRRKL